jgi:hypothetical protein
MFGLLSLVLLLSCRSAAPLTDTERAKLDPPLLALLHGEAIVESQYDISTRPDGTKEYGVILRCSNVDDVQAMGIQVGSVFGDVVTARLTVAELRTILALPSVRAVQNGSTNYLQEH